MFENSLYIESLANTLCVSNHTHIKLHRECLIPSGTSQSCSHSCLSIPHCVLFFLLLPTIKIHLSKAAPSLTISRSCRWLNKLIDGIPDWRFPPQPTPFSEWIWTYPHFYLTNATLLLSSSSSCRCVPRHESGLKLIPPAVGFRATLQEFSFYFFLSSPFGGVSHTLFTL